MRWWSSGQPAHRDLLSVSLLEGAVVMSITRNRIAGVVLAVMMSGAAVLGPAGPAQAATELHARMLPPPSIPMRMVAHGSKVTTVGGSSVSMCTASGRWLARGSR